MEDIEKDRFSTLPPELTAIILCSLMPEKINRFDDCKGSFEAIIYFSQTNKKNYNLVRSNHFFPIKNKFFSSLSSDIAVKEIKKNFKKKNNTVLNDFEILNIEKTIQSIKNKNSEKSIKYLLEIGFNPNFVIQNKSLLSYVDFSLNPELTINLLNKGARSRTALTSIESFLKQFNHSPDKKQKKILKKLVRNGLNPNDVFEASGSSYQPLLSFAIKLFPNDIKLITFLLRTNANPYLKYTKKNLGIWIHTTPLEDAQSLMPPNPELIKLLNLYSNCL